jgi:hypothetical protein
LVVHGNLLACTVQLEAGDAVTFSVYDTSVDPIEASQPQLTTLSGYLVGPS